MDWTTACPDWQRRIVASESLIAAPRLYPAEADTALEVFKALRMVDVVSSPLLGEISRPWLLDFVGSIFGSYDHETGRRLITEYFLLISKKNSKSSSAAAIMLTALIRNWRQSGEFLIISPTIEIANNSFYPARDMIRADEDLSDLFHVQEHYRTITHRVTNATLKVVAADNETVSGKKAAGILIDELWLFGKRNNAENMLREATGGLASRPEGFVIYLSTQSDEPPAGVFKQKLDYARGVRDGRIKDKRFLPILYEFPEDMIKAEAYKDPANFYVTNPNLGCSVSEEFMRRELIKAEEAGEESMRGFLAKHLNVEIGLGLKSQYWAGGLFWEQQADPALSLEALLKRSDVVTVGIDGGGLDDMLALTVEGREEATGHFLHWTHAWLHPIALERRKREAARYRDFQKQGDLTIVDEVGQDVDQLIAYVKQVKDSNLLDKVGVDPAGIGQIVDALNSIGIGMDQIVGIPQGWKLTGAIKSLERKLADKSFYHCGAQLMDWCVGNARVEARGNAILITKQAAGFAKIDPLSASFNAEALMNMNPQSKKNRHQLFFI